MTEPDFDTAFREWWKTLPPQPTVIPISNDAHRVMQDVLAGRIKPEPISAQNWVWS